MEKGVIGSRTPQQSGSPGSGLEAAAHTRTIGKSNICNLRVKVNGDKRRN